MTTNRIHTLVRRLGALAITGLCLASFALGQTYLFIVDEESRNIKRFDGLTGAFINDFVPAGAGGLHFPQDLGIGTDGIMYVGDFYAATVRRYDLVTGTYVGDLFPSHAGGLDYASFIAVAPDNSVWVAAGYTGIKHYAAGTGVFLGDIVVPLEASGYVTSAMRVHTDGLLYAEMGRLGGGAAMIVRYNATTGAFVDIFIPEDSGRLGGGHGIAFDAAGRIYLSDQYNHNIHRYDGTTGAYIDEFVPTSAGVYEPIGLDFGPDGNLYVAHWWFGNRILKFSPDTGGFLGEFVSAASGAVSGPYSIKFHTMAPAYDVYPLYDQTKAHRRGSTVPIKLQVLNGSGANVSSSTLNVHAVSVTLISGSAPGSLEDSGAANPDFNFRFDQGLDSGGGYIFNVSLKGYSTGTYALNFTIRSDPTLHQVQFQVR